MTLTQNAHKCLTAEEEKVGYIMLTNKTALLQEVHFPGGGQGGGHTSERALCSKQHAVGKDDSGTEAFRVL